MKKTLLFSILCASLACACTSPKKADLMVNDRCPMSGQAVDDSQYVDYGDKRIYTCCDKCLVKVKADPAAAAAKASFK